MPARNHHGTLVVLGERGVLILGPSRSGKTALALRLIKHCATYGRFAWLVSDDQLFLSASDGRLVGHAPSPIAGLVEAVGRGPVPIPHEPAAVIDLAVRLVPEDEAPRFQEGEEMELEGLMLPCMALPCRSAESAASAVAARLLLPPFG